MAPLPKPPHCWRTARSTPDWSIFVADLNPYKQGKFMSGSHLPIVPPTALLEQATGLCSAAGVELRRRDPAPAGGIGSAAGKFIIPIPNPIIV
jgi:hypothetical protein